MQFTLEGDTHARKYTDEKKFGEHFSISHNLFLSFYLAAYYIYTIRIAVYVYSTQIYYVLFYAFHTQKILIRSDRLTNRAPEKSGREQIIIIYTLDAEWYRNNKPVAGLLSITIIARRGIVVLITTSGRGKKPQPNDIRKQNVYNE